MYLNYMHNSIHINVANELGLVTLILFILFSFLSYSCKHLGCVQYLHIYLFIIYYYYGYDNKYSTWLPTIRDIL